MNKNQRVVPFGEFPMEDNMVQISVLTPDRDGKGYFNVEKPDAEYGFKSARITYPELEVMRKIGFTDEEIVWIKKLLKNNMSFVSIAEKYAYA